jgi:protoporphyrinogen oxidase
VTETVNTDRTTDERPTLVLGGGPAGLTAGYLLAKQGKPVVVLEAEDQVGGIAKTVERDGYRFDLGGHRFFTKVQEVDDLWHEIMREEFLERPRMSRIFWNKKFLHYPLQGMDVVKKLGPVELVRALASYVKAAIFPKNKGKEENLEDWVSNRFGKRLYTLFFKSYNEKVWGVPATEIRAEWAAQRIKNLSFFRAAWAAFFGNKDDKVTSLIGKFHYPRFGPGQMWEQMTQDIRSHGGEVLLNTPVTKIERDQSSGRVTRIWSNDQSWEPAEVISSLELRATVGLTEPSPAEEVRKAAQGLRYRDFITVALVLDGEDLFPDNWIYIHEPDVEVGRIQNFRSWSPWMVPDEDKACVGMEYFVFAGDELWETDDEKLVELATKELIQIGLAKPGQVQWGYAVRVPKAYPMYDPDYSERVDKIRDWLETIPNLQQVGRNGLHRYNNSDHSMLTAMRAVDNITLGTNHDLWAVNAESVYHEEDVKEEQPYISAPETASMAEPLAAAPAANGNGNGGPAPTPPEASDESEDLPLAGTAER